MRAFIVTRIGDVGFLIGILMLAAAIPTLKTSARFLPRPRPASFPPVW